MDYINEKALDDNDTSLKFALLFSSRFFDSLAMNDLKVRSKMMSLLERNYQNAKHLQREDKKRLYNSVTLLGECFHRIRTSQNDPIHILGKSLLNLLIQTINEDDYIDQTLARVILSQITLNGTNLKNNHKDETDELLFHVRRHLIEQPDLTDTTKALLLMTLDLHNNQISHLSKKVVEMYTEYLKRADNPLDEICEPEVNQSPPQVQKKWSEQVGEELYNDTSFGTTSNENTVPSPTKYSPREQYWRQPRYNRDQHEEYPQRRQSGNFEDDRQSVRSEGGTLKIYNVKDKQRHNNHNRNSNNNWNNSHRYNQGRRYENDSGSRSGSNYNLDYVGNNNRSNENLNEKRSNNYRNNNTYERPPRFRQKDMSKTWRHNNSRPSSSTRDEYRDDSRDQFNNSRSSSRTRTLPRNSRRGGNMNNGRRSVSPSHSTVSERNFRPHQQRHFGSNNHQNNNNTRYSSQSSLASDYGTWDRRSNNFRRNDHGPNNKFRQHDSWNRRNDSHNNDHESISNTNDEIVKHARETTKYLETLSQQ